MKKVLKKISVCLFLVCTLAAALFASACTGGKKADGNIAYMDAETLVVTVTEADEGATLKDLMTCLQENGNITFAEDGSGMVTQINNRTAGNQEYWALYTSNEEYGATDTALTVGILPTCYFAVVGYAAMPVAAGDTFIWAISTW